MHCSPTAWTRYLDSCLVSFGHLLQINEPILSRIIVSEELNASASNFFELAVAAAISLLRFYSGAALATVVRVLIEVPVTLLGAHRQSIQRRVRP